MPSPLGLTEWPSYVLCPMFHSAFSQAETGPSPCVSHSSIAFSWSLTFVTVLSPDMTKVFELSGSDVFPYRSFKKKCEQNVDNSVSKFSKLTVAGNRQTITAFENSTQKSL